MKGKQDGCEANTKREAVEEDKRKVMKEKNDSRCTSGTVTRSNGSLNLPIPSKGQQCRADEDGQ